MQPYEIKSKLEAIPTPIILGSLLFFDAWDEPEDFYTMGVKKRHALRQRYVKLSKEPTKSNMWIWFGAYSHEGKPRINNSSVPGFLYQVIIKPTNSARLRGILNTTASDVNPFKYFNSFKSTALELAAYRASLAGVPMTDMLSEKNNSKFQEAVSKALEDVNTYYFIGVTPEELKSMLITMNHMPLAIDEAIKRSGKF